MFSRPVNTVATMSSTMTAWTSVTASGMRARTMSASTAFTSSENEPPTVGSGDMYGLLVW